MTAFRHGLVWGKFLPLHAGHSLVIRAALEQCDRVTVVLGARRDEPIPRDVRRAWLEEVHPEVEVRVHWDDAPVDYTNPEVWDQQMAQLRTVLPSDLDAVFTSEAYGDELGRRLDLKHVCVDRERRAHPVAGSAVCPDPDGYWSFLSPPVRAWFVRRIVVLGAESTGTTTLANALADQLDCEWVPEYGREWSRIRPGGLVTPWRSEEFDHIARCQAAEEDGAARRAHTPWLVCDTDALATAIWHERYVAQASAGVEELAAARRPFLYVLTADDIPFVQDGLRDGEHLRDWMTDRFREVLAQQRAPVVEVGGSVQARVMSVLAEIRRLQSTATSLRA